MKKTLRVVGGAKQLPKLSTLDKRYFAALHQFVDELFNAACDEYDMTWAQFAAAAQVCDSTVAKLENRETQLPRFQTIYKLAAAVGRQIKFEKLQAQVNKSGFKVVGVGGKRVSAAAAG